MFQTGTPVHLDHPESHLQPSSQSVLAKALHTAGLVNYPTEWWHWSYGDRYWAMASACRYFSKAGEMALEDAVLQDRVSRRMPFAARRRRPSIESTMIDHILEDGRLPLWDGLGGDALEGLDC